MNRGEAAAEAEGRGDPVNDEEAAFADFYRQVSQAEGVAEAEAAVRAADKGWQAHMTYMERRSSSRWRQQSGVRHVKKDDGEPESIEELLRRAMAEREPGAA